MRSIPTVVLSVLCAACASTSDVEPREYLDEQTAATINVVAEPWIFSRERTNVSVDQRDFLNVYAVDVNRMGDHRQYLAVLQSQPLLDERGRELPPPTLQLQTGGEVLELSPALEDPKQFGVAQPIADSYSLTSKWWWFPVDKATLARIAHTQNLQVALASGETRTAYVLWRDGRAEAAAMTAVIP